tara:strand:+ start:21151 stop:22041 length:891 start_codon:yes stop_codon:yes gene_type:complete
LNNNILKKVIIPVAGLGTRMLPATKAIPKEMLPIINKPIIQHIVEEAIYAGFREIIFVTHSSKNSIEDHFDKSFELETILEKRVKRKMLKEIRSISKLNVSFQSVRQPEALGLGHAILCAKKIIGKEPFGIILPDMLISEDKVNNGNAFKKMKEEFVKNKTNSILLAKAKKKDLNKYGVADFNNKRTFSSNIEIVKFIEKPSFNKAPSNFYAAGRYIFENKMMDLLQKVKPDKSEEIQLTDAINDFLNSVGNIKPHFLGGKIFDCGEKLYYLLAILEFASKDKSLKNEMIKYLSIK